MRNEHRRVADVERWRRTASTALVLLAWPLLSGCGSDPSEEDERTGATEHTGGSGGGGVGGGLGAGGTIDEARFEALIAAVQADLDASTGDAAPTAVSVAVWIDGQVVWVCGLGAIDAQKTKGPPGEHTLFMIGSDTKKLTAISLLRKVQAGLATLDTQVADVVPDLQMKVDPAFEGATLRELLSHQGGVLDDLDVSTTTTDAALEAYALGEFAATYYPLAPPGAIWNYSNPNFSVAGLVDQRLDGRMWPDIVEQDLFAPLGMTRSFARKGEVDDDHADGVGTGGTPGDVTNGPVSLDEAWDAGFARPAGLVWSTPSDQMRLAAFLVDGDPNVLAKDLLGELETQQVVTYPDFSGGYGFGLFVDDGFYLGEDWYDTPLWSHGGNTRSHSSHFYVLPEQRFAISILTNGGIDDFDNSLATALETLAGLPPPSAGPAVPFEPSELDALTGSYVDPFNVGEVVVKRAGDALTIDMPALDSYQIAYAHEMTPISTHVWLANIDGGSFDISFVDGPGGETYFRSRPFVAVRASQFASGPGSVGGGAPPPRAASRESVLRALRARRGDSRLGGKGPGAFVGGG